MATLPGARRRRFLPALLLGAILATVAGSGEAATPEAAAPAAAAPRFRADAVVFKLRATEAVALPAQAAARASAVAQQATGAAQRGRVTPVLPPAARSAGRRGGANLFRLELPEPVDVEATSRRLAADPRVEYAEPIYQLHAAALTDDPYLASSGTWGQAYGDLWGLHQIGAPAAWGSGSGEGVVVAVVDTGSDPAHPDLAGNVWRNPDELANGVDDDGNGFADDLVGWDFVNTDAQPTDDNGHGTHVAGTVAAVGDDGFGVVGVAWNARAMALKGLDAAGNGWTDQLAAAILYAVAEGADVINASFGGSVVTQVLEDALRQAHEAGVVVVAAAGNSNADAGDFHPCSSRWVLCVAATDPAGGKTAFSNYGTAVDLGAPGGPAATETTGPNILSALAAGTSPSSHQHGPHVRLQGTSMAAPHVTGAAAVLVGANPGIDVESLRQALRRGAVPGPAGAGLGAGRLDIPGAMADLAGGRGAARITAPPARQYVSGPVIFEGIATATDFASYRVEVGAGTQPTAWTLVHEGSTPVDGGELATWEPAAVTDAQTARLTVTTSSGRTYVDHLDLSLRRVKLTSPQYFDAIRAGDVVTIRGTVAYPGMTRWELTLWDNGVPRSSAGITLTGGGLAPVVDGVLGVWDTSGITAPVYRMLTLAVYTGTDRAAATNSIRLFLDPDLHPGWPRFLPSEPSQRGFHQNGTVADLDGDTLSEILVGQGAQVHAFRHHGSEAAGWPVQLPAGLVTVRSPAVADLDGDGSPEVVVTTVGGQLLVYEHDGVLRVRVPGTFGAYAALGDVAGDARREIVVSGAPGRVAGVSVLDADGRVLANGCALAGWAALDSVPGQPALGDLDGDGKLDVVVAQRLGRVEVTACRGDGTPLWPAPVELAALTEDLDARVIEVPPTLGDLDGDGALEVIAGNSECQLSVIDRRGGVWLGWPATPLTPERPLRCSHVALGDVDARPGQELVIGAEFLDRAMLVVVDAAGRPLPGWPVAYGGEDSGANGPAIVDLDGDGRPEIVVAGAFSRTGDHAALHAFHADGALVPGYPRKSAVFEWVWWGNTPAVLDLDGDGLLELLWMGLLTSQEKDGALMMLWDLPGAARPRAGDWPMFRHDAAHTGVQPAAACGSPTTGAFFYTLSPCRVLDTRITGGPLRSGVGRQVTFGGCQVPAEAVAVAVNLTVLGRGAGGHVSAAPACSAFTTSAINFGPGAVRANNAVLQLGPDGATLVQATLAGSQGVDLLIDVFGYFAPISGAASSAQP